MRGAASTAGRRARNGVSVAMGFKLYRGWLQRSRRRRERRKRRQRDHTEQRRNRETEKRIGFARSGQTTSVAPLLCFYVIPLSPYSPFPFPQWSPLPVAAVSPANA